ncbi:lipopolysaccharide biosynthesis protein [Algibacter pacificus]|uniref:lipopolysaccharide biosynthesis protein n=1 Tax=Algibacter pacificus TaxID=2599389 RepID=UPI0011C9275F|nr:polysaccharide biosynthesis C-terminal domain-containing protein [Algibacter pacificus]
MGVVASQSFKNIVSTYLGFVVGAINTLFLYTKFLKDQDYGMVGYMLSLAYVIMPLMAFGAHNALVKFYTTFKTRESLNSFLTLMLLLPIAVIIPVVFITYCGYGFIADVLANKNAIIKNYLWHTVIIAISLAYFELFFSWAKVQMQTVVGNFMKEVFHRVGTMLLLFLFYFKYIDLELFMAGLVVVYFVRMLIMKVYAFSLKLPILTFQKINDLSRILKYSGLIIIAGTIATSLLDVDKVMLGYYIPIKEIAYYNVAIFITAVIAVPQRSMHQLLMPMTAKFLNERNYLALKKLYKRSSLNLFIVAGFIFLLIVLNINQLYLIIPQEFNVGLYVVFMISIVKLYDALLGSNNAILFNSDYYRIVLVLGVVLVAVMVILNIVFIPVLGINGAGLATFLAVFLYNSVKLFFVYKKYKITPFSAKTIQIGFFIGACILLFYFWDFSFHPILNIALKSFLITILYVFIVFKFRFSEDISKLLIRYLKL